MPRRAEPNFAPDSMIRRVIGERSVGAVWGARASLIGAMHPVAMEGTAASSHGRRRPFGRLGSTARAFNEVIFGTREQAEAQSRRVRAMHDRVNGTLEVDGGPAYPPGTRYDAYDPEASLWTLAVLAESGLTLYEALCRRLTPSERDDYWADMVTFGQTFGMPDGVAPADWQGFRRWYDDLLRGGRLHLTPTGYRAGINVALKGPLPTPLAPVRDLFYLLIVGTAPQQVRDAYALEWTAGHQIALDAVTRTHRATHRLVPRRLRTGNPQPLLDLVVAEERRRIRTGRPTWSAA